MWFRTAVGGENNRFDINVEQVQYAEYRTVGDNRVGERLDVVLHMADGRELTINPDTWEAVRGPLRPTGGG